MGAVRILDGDGHILEDPEGMAKFLPAPYSAMPRSPRGRGPAFPALDHFHGSGSSQPDPERFGRGTVGPKEWEAFLDDTGIEATVIYPTSGLAYGKVAYADWAIALTRAYNDWLHETFVSQSSRIHGMGLIPMQDPETAVEELKRVVTELGMCGAMLPSTGLRTHLGAKEYWPVYAEAERLGCALSIHGGCHDRLGFDDLEPFAAVHALGHPYGVGICFAAMIASGVFDRFPDLKVAFLEGGVGWFIMMLERLDGSYKGFYPYNDRGVLLQIGRGEKVSDYIRKLVQDGRLLIGIEGDEPALAFAVEQVGAEGFLYSSDFPHEVTNASVKEEIHELLENEKLTQADKEAILSKNAERFYQLQPVAVGA